METFASLPVWGGFIALVAVLLVIDLALHRDKQSSMRASVVWSVVWIALGVSFGGALWVWRGTDVALQYFAGYVVEKSLSVDNVFVFLVLFSTFAVPHHKRHRVLFYGVVGAIALRLLFIVAGAEALEHFHFIVVPLGALLAFTGTRLWKHRADDEAPGIVRVLARILPSTNGALWPAIIAIEIADIVFAVDSVPAVFAVTEDPFLVFASNVFALLGLRALTFVVADSLSKLAYLKHGLAAILMFVGVKLAVEPWLSVPVAASLAVIAGILTIAIGASIVRRRRESRLAPTHEGLPRLPHAP